MKPRLLFVTGVMAAGKSTLAQELACRLNPSVHIRGDTFRRMIVNGRVDMGEAAAETAMEQLLLRYELTANAAMSYLRAGFNVVAQDVVVGTVLADMLKFYDDAPLYLVMLNPNRATVEQREATRSKTGYGAISVEQLLDAQAQSPQVGLWIDNSNQAVEQTADHVLANLQAARIQLPNR